MAFSPRCAGVLCILLTILSFAAARIPLEEERLIDNLLDGYGTYARPAHNQSVAVRVGHSFELLYVTAKEEHEGQTIVVETTNWLTTDWTDIRLQWDPREYAGIKTISLAPKQIWTPDIVLYNSYGSLDTRHQGYLVLIEHTGAVKWIPSTKLTVSCPADDNHYACKWTFGSWVHNGYELDLYTPQKSMGVAHYTPNPDWEVSNTSAKREVKHYPCCPEPYIDILYTMDIVKTGTRKKGEKPKDRQRKLFSHVIQDSGDVEVERHGSDLTHVLLLPTVIVSLLVPVQFLVPPESSQRVTVLTILLVALVGMFFVMHGAGHKLLESTIDLDHFYYVSIVWVFAALLLSIFTLHICRWGHKRSKVPDILRKIFLNCLSKLVCINCNTGYDVMSASVSKDLVEEKPDIERGSRLELQMAALLNLVKGLNNYVMEARENQGEWYLLVLVLDRLHCVTFLVVFIVYACSVLV